MKSIRTIRPVSAEELTTLLVSLEEHRTYCKDQLARARSVDLDQELFWNERIDRCSLLLNDLCGSTVSLIDEEWDGTTARDFEDSE